MDPGKLATLSRAAYSSWIVPEEHGFKSARAIPGGGTMAFWLLDAERTVVVFRGTEPTDLRDWLTDAAALRNECDVHSGFARALDRVWPEVLYSLHAEQRAEVWFTGHSLGGALAIEAARRYGLRSRVRAFGAPRLYGSRTPLPPGFAQQVMCYLHGADIVPRLPPTRLECLSLGRQVPEHIWPRQRYRARFYGYRDVGRRWWYDGNRWISDPSQLRVLWWLIRRGGRGLLADHAVVRYEAAAQDRTLP